MKPVKLTLPIQYKGGPIQVGYNGTAFYASYRENTIYFIVNPKLLYVTIGLLSLLVIGQFSSDDDAMASPPANDVETPKYITSVNYQPDFSATNEDVIGYFLQYFNEYEKTQKETQDIKSLRENFLVKKQLLVTKYLIEEKVARVDQLSDKRLLSLHAQISQLFTENILNNIPIESHVYHFLTQIEPLKKIETSLMEQTKYNIPASIKIAQAALETGYGQKVVNNNYFGIKDKKHNSPTTETIEYYTAKEVNINQNKILTKEKVIQGNKTLYKCRIRDSFAQYTTPWQSFRAHSEYLNQNTRYSPLFTKGKNYKAWADKIGSSKYGGVGYATLPIYGELLKKIIARYHLDLLDY